MHQYPKVKMSFSTTSFQHSVLLWTRTPSVPSAQQPAVLLLQSLFSSVVSASFGCHSPSRHYCEVLCFPTAHARCGVCSETSPSERIPVCRETSGAVCSLCFSLGFFNPVLSNLNRKCFYFFSNYYDWAFFPWVVFWFFFFCPLPNLGCLHCKPDSVECWVCLKPALQRWLCPLKPASFLNMECSQLTPWEINCGWFNQPRFWLTDSRDSSCLFWKGQNDCTKITCLALISDSQEHGHLVDFVYVEDVFES